MRVRFLIQDMSPRSWLRGHFIAGALAQAGKQVAYQVIREPRDLQIATNYDVTVLVNWLPFSTLLPPTKGLVIWDIPEDLDWHVAEARQLARQVPAVFVDQLSAARQVAALCHHVRVVPTPLPDRSLWSLTRMPDGVPERRLKLTVIGDQTIAETEMIRDASVKLSAMPEMVQFVTLLRCTQVVLFPDWARDGGWVRLAALCGARAGVGPEADVQLDPRLGVTCRPVNGWTHSLLTDLAHTHPEWQRALSGPFGQTPWSLPWQPALIARQWWQTIQQLRQVTGLTTHLLSS